MDKKRFNYALPLLLFLGAYTTECYAQNMSIQSTNGTQVVLDLTTVQSMVFKNGNMIVSDADCGDRYFSQFFTTQVQIGQDAAISDYSASNEILVYPNPASDEMTIARNTGTAAEVSIYSVFGELVQQSQVSGNEASISVAELTSGVYFLNIDQQQIKFVKQ